MTSGVSDAIRTQRDIPRVPTPLAGPDGEAPSGRIDRLIARPAVGAALLIAAVVLPLFRQVGTPSWRTVWAEDGSVYSQQAVNIGAFRVLFRGYNGYLQLPPRLLALPTPLFSLRYLAVYCSLVAVVVAALLAWGLYHWSRGWIASRFVRVALASLVVLMPASGQEATANLTNLIWAFLAVLPWALISMEERSRDVVTRSAVALLGAASSLLALCFLPLALGWLVYRRSRAALIVTGSFVVGAVLQLAVAQVTPQRVIPQPTLPWSSNLLHILEGLGGHVFGFFLFGTRWEVVLGSSNETVSVVLPVILVLTLLVVLGVGASGRARVVAGVFTLTAIAMFAGVAWQRDPQFYQLAYTSLYLNQRYSVVPVALLASAVALLVSDRGNRASHQRARKIGGWLFVAQTAAVVIACFSLLNVRSYDPPWIGRVDHAVATQCANRPSSVLATIPNQAGYKPAPPEGWFPVTVPCAHLR